MKFVNLIFGCTIRVMRICMLGLVALAAARAQQGGDIQSMLARVSEEAEVFAHSARSVLSEETLHQRTRKPVSRFHPRVAEATPPKEEFVAREIVSAARVPDRDLDRRPQSGRCREGAPHADAGNGLVRRQREEADTE